MNELERYVFSRLYAMYTAENQKRALPLSQTYKVEEALAQWRKAVPRDYQKRQLFLQDLLEALKGQKPIAGKHRMSKKFFIRSVLERYRVYLDFLAGRL